MRRSHAQLTGAVLAVAIVVGTAWGFFFTSTLPTYRGHFTTIVDCFCWPPAWHRADSERLLAANGWFKTAAGRFTLYAPPNTIVRPANAWDGRIVTQGFALDYEFGAPGFATGGRDPVDEPVRIEGRDAQLRRATLDGAAPYFAGLFVPKALMQGGQPLSLLITGRFRTRGERARADAMLATVSFRPHESPDWERRPPQAKVEEPVVNLE